MLLRHILFLGLASLSLALPTSEEVDTSKPGIYVTDTYTDEHGIERRSTKAIDAELHERLVYYSEYTAAAYCSPQQGKTGGKVSCSAAGAKTCLHVEKSDTKVHSAWIAIGNNSATGFVASDHTKKKIVLSMRGSVSLSNWIADIKFIQRDCPAYGRGAACSIGFLGFWEQCRPEAMKGLLEAVKENPTYGIVVAGHSLGGAGAVYAAGELRKQYKDVEMYTFGQPRAGNEIMSKFITDQGKNWRVTHTSDAVPKLPPEGGPLGVLSGNYKHVSPEYWISDGVGMKTENIKVLEGLSNDNGNTGTGHMKFNIVAHVQYFQTNLYYCVVPLPDLFGYAAGTKLVDDGSGPWPTSPAKWNQTLYNEALEAAILQT